MEKTERPIRILISGNCLGAPLEATAAEAARILRAPLEIRYVPNYIGAQGQEPSADLKEFAREADFFICQIGATMADSLAEIVPATAKVFRFPAVRLNFLWPFATRPHPLERYDKPYNEHGIFNVYLSDSLLTGIMEEETDPERVFERFMQVDPREHTNLDRLFDATRRQFKLNEAQSDIELWDGIESRFRSERLFWDAGHPAWACWWPVAEAMLQFLDQYLHLGVDAQVMKALRSRLDQISPLRYYDAPVHPRIAEHFGLSWHRPDMRYRLDHDGWFTYEEWVRRFIGFRFDLRCYSGYWHTFKQCGDRRQGERDLRGALADSPNNAQTNFYLATNLLWSDRPAEALTEVEAALADPDVAADSRSPALHAEILLRLKRPAEAVEAARRATALMPQNADYHRLFGKALRESGQSGVGPSREGLSDETLSAFRKAVDLDPFKVANWNELGFQLVLEKDEPAAETCLQRVLDLDADNILALGHLAVIHDNRRDLAQALPMARRAVSLDPENIGLLRRLGSIALRAGLLEEAEAACRRATALGEKDFYAWFDLGNVLFRLGRFAEADEATQTALALNPKIPVFSFQAGEIRASLGDDASAREYFRVAAELAPDNAKMRAKYEAVK